MARMLLLHKPDSMIYVPDGTKVEDALTRTSQLGVGAHQDDLEIMAFHGILNCFLRNDEAFTGVTVTDGRGSARDGIFQDYTDEQMAAIRKKEQNRAADTGAYSAMIQLNYPSREVKDPNNTYVVEDIARILQIASPGVIYTHNLADKHDTHVSVALRTIEAIRDIPPSDRPLRLYGCEVWRGLEWMLGEDVAVLDVSKMPDLQNALLSVYTSQIAGGKRYDLGTLGRRASNATYLETHETDKMTGVTLAMDLTPLIQDPTKDIAGYVGDHIQKLHLDVAGRIGKYLMAKTKK